MIRRSLILLAALALCATSYGDVLHLKTGGTVEGEIVEEAADKILIRTKFGVQQIARADIERVEKKETPEQEFERRKTEAAGNADALMEVYLWAKTNKMNRQATAVLREIIEVDPDNANARKLLGYVQHDGKWVTEKEKTKLEGDAQRQENERLGLVEHDGKWMTPEEKEEAIHLERGEIRVGDAWVSKKDYERSKRELEAQQEAAEHKAKGEFLVDGKWVPKAEAEAYYADIQHPYVTTGEFVNLHTNRGIDFADKMLVTADATYRLCHEFFGKAPAGGGKFDVFVAAELDDYNALGNQWGGDKSSNFSVFCSEWLPETDETPDIVSVALYFQSEQNTEMYVKHAVAEQYVMRLLGRDASDTPPRWFVDGVASYIERWQSPKLFTWSRDRLHQVGWVLKLKTLCGGGVLNEQSILQSGMLVAFLKSPDCPADVAEAFNEAVVAVNEGKKVSKSFRDLEKLIEKNEDAFLTFAQK
jgi:hypothetical protein